MVLRYILLGYKFLFSIKFFMKDLFIYLKYYVVNFEVRYRIQKRFHNEYAMYTYIIILWKKGCQLIRNFVCDETHINSYGLGLIASNEVYRHIVYILGDILSSYSDVYMICY